MGVAPHFVAEAYAGKFADAFFPKKKSEDASTTMVIATDNSTRAAASNTSGAARYAKGNPSGGVSALRIAPSSKVGSTLAIASDSPSNGSLSPNTAKIIPQNQSPQKGFNGQASITKNYNPFRDAKVAAASGTYPSVSPTPPSLRRKQQTRTSHANPFRYSATSPQRQKVAKSTKLQQPNNRSAGNKSKSSLVVGNPSRVASNTRQRSGSESRSNSRMPLQLAAGNSNQRENRSRSTRESKPSQRTAHVANRKNNPRFDERSRSGLESNGNRRLTSTANNRSRQTPVRPQANPTPANRQANTARQESNSRNRNGRRCATDEHRSTPRIASRQSQSLQQPPAIRKQSSSAQPPREQQHKVVQRTAPVRRAASQESRQVASSKSVKQLRTSPLVSLPPVEATKQQVVRPVIQQPVSIQSAEAQPAAASVASPDSGKVLQAAANSSPARKPQVLPVPKTATFIPEFDAQPPEQAKIVYRPAVPDQDENGRLVLRPQVNLTGGEYVSEIVPTPSYESMPEQVYIAPETLQGSLPDLQSIPIESSSCGVGCGDCVGATPCEVSWCQKMNGKCKAGLYNLFGACPSQDVGIGRSRLPFAPFFIERSQPLPGHVGFRLDAGWDYDNPVRSEYFLGNPKNPAILPTSETNFQEFRLSFEVGSNKFSTITELPIRGLDPATGSESDADAGFGDMAIGTRLVMLDGKVWQISQLFRTTINTGDVNKGLGTGHVSLEPGIAYRLRFTEDTFFYGDVKLNIPVGADPTRAGEVVQYGLGISTVYLDADDFAILPTLELVATSFLDGKSSFSGTPAGDFDVAYLYPGIRFVCDPGADIRLWELGIATGIPVTGDRLYSSNLRVDLRWNF